jgi:hypothetical protein
VDLAFGPQVDDDSKLSRSSAAERATFIRLLRRLVEA